MTAVLYFLYVNSYFLMYFFLRTLYKPLIWCEPTRELFAYF